LRPQPLKSAWPARNPPPLAPGGTRVGNAGSPRRHLAERVLGVCGRPGCTSRPGRSNVAAALVAPRGPVAPAVRPAARAPAPPVLLRSTQCSTLRVKVMPSYCTPVHTQHLLSPASTPYLPRPRSPRQTAVLALRRPRSIRATNSRLPSEHAHTARSRPHNRPFSRPPHSPCQPKTRRTAAIPPCSVVV